MQGRTWETPRAPVIHHSAGGMFAIRDGKWKLIGNPKDTSNKAPLGADDALFLVNLATDIGEMNNVSNDNPEIVSRMKKMHEQWLLDVQKQ